MAAVKTTGAEFNNFYTDDEFWAGAWHDDTLVFVDGVELADLDDLPPAAKVVIDTGVVIHQDAFGNEKSTEDLLKFFRRWKKNAKTETFVVTVNKTANIKQIKVDIAAIEGVQSVK